MSHHGSLSQLLIVVHGPSEFVYRRSQREGRICDSSGNHYVGSLLQCLHYSTGPYVSVGRHYIVCYAAEGLSGLQYLEVHIPVYSVYNVVSQYAHYLKVCQAVFSCHPSGNFHGRLWIGCAHVGYDLYFMIFEKRKNFRHAVLQQFVVAFVAVFLLLLLGEGYGSLRQTFKDYIIQISEANQVYCRLYSVAAVSGSASYSYLFQISVSFHHFHFYI